MPGQSFQERQHANSNPCPDLAGWLPWPPLGPRGSVGILSWHLATGHFMTWVKEAWGVLSFFLLPCQRSVVSWVGSSFCHMSGNQYGAWPHRLILLALAEEDCLPRSPPPADHRPPWPWEGQRSAFLLAMAPVELPHGPESRLKREPLSKSAWTRLFQGKVFLY